MSTTVITGANRGIGLELARQCIQRGDKVFAGCREPDEAPNLEALEPHSILPIDVGDEVSVLSFSEAIEEPVSLLINNAGTSITNLGFSRDEVGVMNAPVALTLDLIRINGLSAATVTRSLSERLESGSKVANITSQIGSMVVGSKFNDLPYAASKAVMNMVTVQLAAQFEASGIAVVAFHPGWVRTDMGGSSADISVEESAQGILSALETLQLEQSGAFLRWDGSIHPW
ncbi:MAG: short-chain dehydrogenase [Acidimicrobiaceae bacterium]|nr:short-chain dehydrogenase [Acidimicrobiaceae bacterium]